MASLFDRIANPTDIAPKVSVHVFTALTREYARGLATRADFLSALGLSEGAETPQLDALLAKIDGLGNATAKLLLTLAVDDILMLTERRYKYTTQAEFNSRVSAL